MAHIKAMRTENKRLLRLVGIGTGIVTLAIISYFGIQNLIHKIDRQANPTQPNNPLFTPGNDVLNTPTTPTSAVEAQKVDCISVYAQELLQNHNRITVTINGRTMVIEGNTLIELCGIPVTPPTP